MPKNEEQVKVIKPNESSGDSKKIDLYINANPEESEQGISILNVFSRLAKRFHIYIFVMIAGLLLGLLVPTLIYTFKDKKESAIAILGLDYETTEKVETQTKSKAKDKDEEEDIKLDISYLKSSYIVQNALNNVTLTKKVTTAQVQNNIVITGILTDETKQQLDILKKLEESKSAEYAKFLQSLTLQYKSQYIIKINSVFESGNSKVVLPSSDLSLLLNSVINAYRDYVIDTYQKSNLPDDYIGAINAETLDYLETIDIISDSLEYLSKYCEEKTELVPNYRTEDGVSFEDLKTIIDALRDTNINQYAAFIYDTNAYKNKDVLKTYYDGQKRDTELELEETNNKITALSNTIDNYKNDTIYVTKADGKNVQLPSAVDEYNELVLELADLNESKSSLEEKLVVLGTRIAKLDDASATNEEKQVAEEYVSNALRDSTNIYNLVNKTAQQLFKSNAYQSRYMHSITTSESEHFSDNLPYFGIGAGIGFGIGFLAWIADAFILEIRAFKKANEEKEDE